jgi:hypothetical protein
MALMGGNGDKCGAILTGFIPLSPASSLILSLSSLPELLYIVPKTRNRSGWMYRNTNTDNGNVKDLMTLKTD